MWILYQLIVLLLSLLAAPVLLLTRGRHYRETLLPRLGFYGERSDGSAPLWVHAVSVGEVGVAATLADRLPGLDEAAELLVTTVTPTGQARAQESFPGARVTYLPFEIGFAVRRFFDRHEPRALVLTEGDLWPLVLRECRRRRLPIVVVNGRVSDRSFTRMRRLRQFLGPMLSPVEHFAVQTTIDRDRLLELGVSAERITVTGNLKFESAAPAELGRLEPQLRRLAGERPILIAGSTMKGEEDAVLEAFERATAAAGALLLLAPRHPERWDRVAEVVARRGLALVRRSELELTGPSEPEPGGSPPDVVLLDSMGELAGAYRLARAAFIGGTLVPTGGHNPLEAARFGVPVVAGPSMENFREIAAAFDRAGAWERVADAAALGESWRRLISDPDAAAALGRRGLELLERHRGAVGRTAEVLSRHLGARLEVAS